MSNFNGNEKFNGTIYINSNINNNKKAIIGNFDLKDLIFILLGTIVGILSMTILFFILKIDSIFICMIVIAIIEIPIITIGFKKVNEIPYLDYIIMNNKSNNSIVRSLRNRSIGKKERYILSYKLNINNENIFDFLDRKVKEISDIFHNKITQIKIGSNGLYLTICIDEDCDVNYEKFIINYIKDKELIGLGLEDIKKYNQDIFNRIIYKSINNIKEQKKQNKNYIDVYKVKIYKDPFNNNFIEEIISFCEVTKYYYNGENNNLNIYITITGDNEEINNKIIKLNNISEKYNILLSEISEEKVKNAISMYMENIY